MGLFHKHVSLNGKDWDELEGLFMPVFSFIDYPQTGGVCSIEDECCNDSCECCRNSLCIFCMGIEGCVDRTGSVSPGGICSYHCECPGGLICFGGGGGISGVCQ